MTCRDYKYSLCHEFLPPQIRAEFYGDQTPFGMFDIEQEANRGMSRFNAQSAAKGTRDAGPLFPADPVDDPDLSSQDSFVE